MMLLVVRSNVIAKSHEVKQVKCHIPPPPGPLEISERVNYFLDLKFSKLDQKSFSETLKHDCHIMIMDSFVLSLRVKK